jgi:hypothetical protein
MAFGVPAMLQLQRTARGLERDAMHIASSFSTMQLRAFSQMISQVPRISY